MSRIKRCICMLLGISVGLAITSCNVEEKPIEKIIMRDTSGDTTLSSSMVHANLLANKVQSYFTDPGRNSYTMTNKQIEMVQEIGVIKDKYVSSLKTRDGKTYLTNTMDVFVETGNTTRFYASNSASMGRVNTTRLGYYYYETHIRDLEFSNPDIVTSGEKQDISGLDLKDWRVNHMEKPIYTEEGMTVTVLDPADPYFLRTGLSVDPAKFNGIEVKLKVEGDAQVADVYFYTSDTGNFNAEQRTQIKLNNNGKFNTYIIDLAGTGMLTGTLQGIRFDIGASVDDKVTVQYVKAVNSNSGNVPFKLDKTFHTYSDKMHQEFRIIALSDVSNVTAFGYEIKLPTKNVDAIQYRDKNGTGSDISKMDTASVEYIAFDIKKTGVIGLIIPPNGTTKKVEVTTEEGFYVLRQFGNLSKETYKRNNEDSFSNRLYTDTTHSFDGIDRAAFLERNPLSGIQMLNNTSKAEFLGYDFARGAYRFTMDGTDFSTAYNRYPDKHFIADIKINNDDNDREFYIWMNTKYGGLECAAILDDTKTSVPIPLQVCKNFKGEIEEPFYDPADNAYGDTFFPMKLEANKETQFTLLNLYQNWGKYPLKQISSIQFHVSYYHLSTGVTESNCIAPYYVYGKDGWTLPDFRGASGIMWSSQPQFNSVGRLYFVSYVNGDNKVVRSEYTDSLIRSAGQTYADMDYNYISDDGSYKYTLRHVEFPQKDENRTYYTLELTFLKNLTIDNVREDFTLFKIDGRSTYFKQTGYLNENNESVVIPVDTLTKNSNIYTLGKENPYFSYFDLVNGDSVMNFGLIVKNYDITIGGKKFNGNLAYKNVYDGSLNHGTLTLDLGKTKFKKGDKITIDLILLPYGSHLDKDDDNVRYVREDSALNPLKVEAIKGTVVPDTYLPRVLCVNNQAEFKITGGRNNNVVRIDGFTNIKKPSIYEMIDGNWVPVEFSVHDYDGYTVHFNMDGTYSFSFVYTMESPETVRHFKIEN